jgi:transposase
VTQVEDPTIATKIALRSLAGRHAAVSEEVDELIAPLVDKINPQLLGLPGVGPDVAGQLLVTAGQNSDRLRSEAAFAMLCGVAPLPASSGKTTRHRLNRDANSALWGIVVYRLKTDSRTRDYAHRRTHQRTQQTRDHPLPQALRRPRGLHHPPTIRRHPADPRQPPATPSSPR